MNPPGSDKVRDALSQGQWDRAVALLQQLGPAVAADVIMDLPFEEQRVLFRVIPDEFAAELISHFPYYHSYVLLHTRSTEHLRAIIARMAPDERAIFLDELPGEAWQRVMDEISGAHPSAAPGAEGGATEVADVIPQSPPTWSPLPRLCRLRNHSSNPTAGISR